MCPIPIVISLSIAAATLSLVEALHSIADLLALLLAIEAVLGALAAAHVVSVALLGFAVVGPGLHDVETGTGPRQRVETAGVRLLPGERPLPIEVGPCGKMENVVFSHPLRKDQNS